MTSNATALATATRLPLPDIDIRLVPEIIEIELQPASVRAPLSRIRPLWHLVDDTVSGKVTVKSTADQVRIVRLSAQGLARGWRHDWPRWVFAVRTAPDLMGGDALAAHDRLSDDETELDLLMLPGETRIVSLEIRAALDGGTHSGHYPFELLATEPETGRSTGFIASLHLLHPQASYLSHLPSLYADELSQLHDPEDPSAPPPFFERYLRGFEDAGVPLGELLGNIYRFFGAYEAPPDFLPWLATWVGLVLDENWPEMKRRRLISEAVELYRWRGTRRGLSRYLEIYAGVKPEIADQPFYGMRLGSATLLGRDTVLGDVKPHTFVVTIAVPDPRLVRESTVRDIIEAQKPAHTAFTARIVQRSAGEA